MKTTRRKKILHLEDDPDWIEIVQGSLSGFDVHSAHNLKEAVELCKHIEFDAAILDISLMPGDAQDDQGEKFLKGLKGLEILPGKRIIVLSAYLQGLLNQDRIRKYFKDYKVLDAIPKQKFDSEEFREVVENAVREPA